MARLNVRLRVYDDCTWDTRKKTEFLTGKFLSSKITKEETMEALRQVVQFVKEWNDAQE